MVSLSKAIMSSRRRADSSWNTGFGKLKVNAVIFRITSRRIVKEEKTQ